MSLKTARIFGTAPFPGALSRSYDRHKKTRMAGKRIPANERKTLILEAARQVFSRAGYDAAKTIEIARAAKVSEALVYRHYPSKEALYRAVLRQTIREQNENFADLEMRGTGAAGIVRTLSAYFTIATSPDHSRIQDRYRLLLASLSGDGNYARLIYRRARRMMDSAVSDALEQARLDGDLRGDGLSTADMSMFIEHIGTMMSAIHSLTLQQSTYRVGNDALVRDAVWFCCRGMGLTDTAIARAIDG